MNEHAPFQPEDLDELDQLLDQATAVIPMGTVALGASHPSLIGLRHDVDNEIESSVQMAQWEADRGYRATYYILHTADYWAQKETLRAALEVIHECGHEIGFHLNALTVAIETGRDPIEIATEAVTELRDYGYPVRGVVAHGDAACYQHNYVNDEIWTEAARPEYGPPDRVVGGVKLKPVSRRSLRFTYDPNWLPRGEYLSDSGGRWSRSFEDVAEGFPFAGQLHVLCHPCWWKTCFSRGEVAA